MAKKRAYSQYTLEALQLMGEQIKLGRKQCQWTEQQLSERAGISRSTLKKIEKGEGGSAIILVFEVAALVGVPLFAVDLASISKHRERIQDKVALLPKRLSSLNKCEIDDDF